MSKILFSTCIPLAVWQPVHSIGLPPPPPLIWQMFAPPLTKLFEKEEAHTCTLYGDVHGQMYDRVEYFPYKYKQHPKCMTGFKVLAACFILPTMFKTFFIFHIHS